MLGTDTPLSLELFLGVCALVATVCGVLAGVVQIVLAYAFGFGELKSDVKAMRQAMEASEARQSLERERHDRAMEAVWEEFGELRRVTGLHGERITAVENRCRK